ncbi:MAG TPA: hypothetical protein VKQ36_06200 [Ktedonobacterales bacterium]|nr:hypothetical protein [Ktedonobacterales bacterium]
MSRSRRKHPCHGVTTAASEKRDKQRDHRRYRHAVQQRLAVCWPDEAWQTPHWREYSNPWMWAKDGKIFNTLADNMAPRLWRK